MRPRTWIESFLWVAAAGGIAFGLGWKLLTDTPAETSTLIGLAFGVVVGLVAASKMAELVVHRQFSDRAAFLAELETDLAQLDLLPKTKLENFLAFESTPAGSFSLGPVGLNGMVKRVRVRIDGNQATIVGPREIVREL